MKFLFAVMALASTSSLLASHLPVKAELTGRIVDAQYDIPLEYATVSVYQDEALITGASTDSLGVFSMSLSRGSYQLKFEYIGYTTLDTLIDLGSDLDLGDVLLSSSAVDLDGVTITAERSRMILKLDKQIFDVGADIVSQGGSANEVLDNVPMVNVSPEGIVSLRGDASVKVLINGKPSALADNNALQGIPASNIERVEIMTNPSAKYEASGSAGIINIILKQATKETWGGQVSATVGVPTETRLAANFNRTKGNLTFFGNAGIRYSNYFSVGSAERISQLPSGLQVLNEDLDQARNDRAGNAFIGIDFRPRERTTLSASYSYYHQTDDDLSDVDYRFGDEAGVLDREWTQSYDYLQPGHYNQVELTWAEDFKKEGSKLLVLFQNDFWSRDQKELTIMTERFPSMTEAFQLRTSNLESSSDFLLQGDYEQKLGSRAKLEAGIRGEMRIISSDYHAEQNLDGQFKTYRDLQNMVDYYERIAAAYVQYAYEHDKWGLQVGLRSEYTNIKVEEAQDGIEPIQKSYNWIFPSTTISYKFSDKLNGSIGYSKRIQRPHFRQLNPFGGIENPNEIRFGNPDLDPSFRDLVEVKLLYRDDKLTLSPFFSAHYIDGFYDTQVLQDSGGLVTYFPINLEQERILVGGLIVTYEPWSGWQLTGELSGAEFRQTGFYEGVDFGNSFRNYNAELGLRGKLPKDIRMQVNFYYYGSQRYLQSFRDPYYGINAGLSRKFLEDRLQISLNVRNLFELAVYRGGATLPTFTNEYARRWQGQRISLTAAWDFGQDSRVRRARRSIR